MNSIIKFIAFLCLAASLLLFISSSNMVIIAVAGAIIITASFLLSEMMIDKEKAEKISFESEEIYLIKQTSPVSADNSFYSRTVGILKPVIVFDKDKFYSMPEAEKKALIYHEKYHVSEHHQLKRFILYAGMTALFICVRLFAEQENTLFIIIGFFLLAAYIAFFILFFRKNEYDADMYSVTEMKESDTLSAFLENSLKNSVSKGLSLHPSVEKRIRNISQYKKS